MSSKTVFIGFALCCIPFAVLHSQTPVIDSLKRALASGRGDKLSTLFELCRRGESMPADTMMNYARTAEGLSIAYDDEKDKWQSECFIARCYNLKGMPDSALRICDRGIAETGKTAGLYDLTHQFMWFRIVALTKRRKMNDAIEECFKLLRSGEKYNDLPARINAYNNLGVNNNILGNSPEALKWFNKAFGLVMENNVSRDFPLVLSNLSALYFKKGQEDSGFFFLRKAFAISRANQNLRNEADCYTLQGLIDIRKGETDSARYMLEQAVVLQKQIGNIQFVLVGISALENFYFSQKDYPRAIGYIRQQQEYSRRFHEPLLPTIYKDLADCYKPMKNFLAYGEAMDTLMSLKDSMYAKNKAEDLAQLEAQYDLTSKEAFIAKQNLELLHKDILIGGSALVILLIAAGGFFLYRRNRRRQWAALSDAEEKERRRIAADLHDNIGAYASAISAGIDEWEIKAAGADMPFIQNLKNNAAEIITSLRDTIWAFNKESISLTGISDRVKIYVQKIRPNYPAIVISIEEDILAEKSLASVRALHIFRIVQEALHNAVRHSHATGIVITIAGGKEGAGIIIEDNGDGFDPGSVRHVGNGLMTMQNRAGEAGCGIIFERPDCGGTRIRLTIENTKS